MLTAAEARTIADTATRCREVVGGHQDVEWALAEGRPIVLQTRPITAIHDVEPVPMDETPPPGPWEWDAAHNRLPLSPLTSSFFCDAFTRAGDRLIETYGAPIKRLVMTTINGYLYIQDGGGLLVCCNMADGSKVYDHDLRNNFMASPSIAGDKLYLLSEEGIMYIGQAGPEYQEVARCELGERCLASPAFVDGRIYIRGEQNLYCIGSASSDATVQ